MKRTKNILVIVILLLLSALPFALHFMRPGPVSRADVQNLRTLTPIGGEEDGVTLQMITASPSNP